MFLGVRPAQQARFAFHHTLHAQMGRRFVALLANDRGQHVSHQKRERMLEQGVSPARAHDFDQGFRRSAEIVDMGEFDALAQDFDGAAGHADFGIAPAALALRELAQVAAAFEPDRAQVSVHFLQGGVAAHLQIEPETGIVGVLHAQVKQRLIGALGSRRFFERALIGRAGAQMAGDGAFADLLGAKRADAFGLGLSRHDGVGAQFSSNFGIQANGALTSRQIHDICLTSRQRACRRLGGAFGRATRAADVS